ncbi:MAG: cytochrome c oxidase assembly protein [Rickettsiales bacterium]|nr:MAG: cytochrome c oxidase assembly protein [Rickettsiales bacterium]
MTCYINLLLFKYSIFCKVTGFGGTPKIAKDYILPRSKGRNIKIRFDSNIDSDLTWKFYPKQREINVKAGDVNVVFYTAENLLDKSITGTAVYNVTPSQAGIYFNKIECFCFTEQTLLPLEKQDMPVSFFIDPEIDNDLELRNTDTITLSYSFFKVK